MGSSARPLAPRRVCWGPETGRRHAIAVPSKSSGSRRSEGIPDVRVFINMGDVPFVFKGRHPCHVGGGHQLLNTMCDFGSLEMEVSTSDVSQAFLFVV